MTGLLNFLNQPEAYPHHPGHVRHIQTHISHVFIVPPFVYKIKKPVDFGFLDYSTLEKRKHFCEQEVKLNRRLCSEIYLGVVPIYRDGDTFVLDGESDAEGEIVEYAVKMKKLPEEYFLHAYLEKGRLNREHLDRITEKLADFYLRQDPGKDILEWGTPDRIRYNMNENFSQTESFLGKTLEKNAFESIKKFTLDTLDKREELFNRRIEEKRIIDGHGDLHLEHIHITNDSICIYDCIEFNKRFRFIDVAADLAFLGMDLDFHGRWKESRYVIDRMSGLLDDKGLPEIIDFYKCYRAFVKGKVKSLQSAEEEVPAEEREAAMEKASRYFNLCLRYALAGSSPVAFIVMGRVGSGKSTLASSLSSVMDIRQFSSDYIRKSRAGLPPEERTPDDVRKELYSEEQSQQTYRELREQALEHLANGKSVILDATFSKKKERESLVSLLDKHDFNYLFIVSQAGDATIKERLKKRDRQDKVVSDARLEDFELIDRHYEEPDEIDIGHITRVNTEQDLEATLRELYRKLCEWNIKSVL